MTITITRARIIVIVVALAIIGSAWWVSQTATPKLQHVISPTPRLLQNTPTPQQQTNDGIDVAVSRLQSAKKNETAFRIALNTHSGDLSVFDAAANVVFKTQTGTAHMPIRIGGDQETHHRTTDVVFSTLQFPGMLLVKNLGSIPERPFSFSQ